MDDADVAGAAAAALFDLAEPMLAMQTGDGQRRDGDGVDPLFGNHPGVTGPAGDVDLHAIPAGGADGHFVDGAAVEVEGQGWLSQDAERAETGAVEADFFLHGPEEDQRRMGQAAAEEGDGGRENGGRAGAVVGPQGGVLVGRHDPAAAADRPRSLTQRDGIDVGHQQSPPPRRRARQLADEVADLPVAAGAAMGPIEGEALRRRRPRGARRRSPR